MRLEFGIAEELQTEIKIGNDQLHGTISPRIYFYAGDQLAFALAFTTTFAVGIEFTLQDLMSIVKGHILDLNMKDWIFTAGTVQSIDTIQLANTWNPVILPMLLKFVEVAVGGHGFEIGFIPLLRSIFKVDIQTIYLKLNEGYLEASFNIDIFKSILKKFAFRGEVF